LLKSGSAIPKPCDSLAANSDKIEKEAERTNERREKKVLLAEDNIVNQKLATLLLQQLDLAVSVVEDGRQAVQAAQTGDFDVILMDCQMPEMDGFEATKAIRKFEALQNRYTPIIAVTALAMVGDRERCIAVGMDDYISKPIDRRVLNIKLNHWLQKEFVVRNQELAKKYGQSGASMSFSENDPVDLPELREFYGDDLEDVLKTYILSAESHIASITQAVNERNADMLASLAHELKGSSASVGAKQLAKLALFLERSAGIRDWKEAKDTLEALNSAFTAVRVFFESVPTMSSEALVLPIRD
jgi:CheY-like chemotaxis protein